MFIPELETGFTPKHLFHQKPMATGLSKGIKGYRGNVFIFEP
jgi:hypothetical protein